MNIYSPSDDVFESLKTFNFNLSDYHNLEKIDQIGLVQSEETKKLISESLKGNTNKKGKTGYKLSEEFKEKRRKHTLEHNPMFNPESVDKIRKSAMMKYKCPHCDMSMNKGNLTKHINSRHQ